MCVFIALWVALGARVYHHVVVGGYANTFLNVSKGQVLLVPGLLHLCLGT